MGIVLLFFWFIFTLLPFQYSAQLYNITPSNPLAVGETLVSPGSIYEIGFFSLSNSTDRYLGLWHNNIYPRKYVWLANREKPLSVADTSATLRISSNGSLELVDGKQNTVWSTTEVSASNSTSAVAVLLDTGNFVVKDDIGADEFMWQSFDYPCDTMLPGQLLGFDSKSGKRYVLTSWKSDNDPSMGIFLSGLSAETPSQVFVWIDNGSTPYYRSGPWDKSKFIGVVNEDTNWQYLSGYTLDDDVKQGTKYLSFYTLVDNISGYTEMSSDGSVRLLYSENGKNWSAVLKLIKNPCDVYGTCGPFGVCRASESPICKCLKGFVPKLHDEWSEGNWSGGCVRQTKLFCDRQTNISVSTTGKIDDGFSKMARSKVPDHHEFRSSLGADANTFEDCKMVCLKNCSCLAYARAYSMPHWDSCTMTLKGACKVNDFSCEWLFFSSFLISHRHLPISPSKVKTTSRSLSLSPSTAKSPSLNLPPHAPIFLPPPSPRHPTLTMIRSSPRHLHLPPWSISSTNKFDGAGRR